MSYRKKHINPKIRGLKKRKKFFQSPIFWWLLFVAMLIGGAVYIILFMPTFQVEKIIISGNEKIKTEDIKNLVAKNIKKEVFGIFSNSIFMVNPSLVTKNMLAALPSVESMRVQKSLPQTINIIIKERTPYALFCPKPDNCFLIDRQGVVFESVQEIPQKIMIITPTSGDDIFYLGQQVVDKTTMDSVVKIQENLKNNFQLDVKEVLNSNPLVITTSENWQIYFDANSSTDLQITKMNALLQSEISANGRKNLQYIYLQYKDKAYYK